MHATLSGLLPLSNAAGGGAAVSGNLTVWCAEFIKGAA